MLRSLTHFLTTSTPLTIHTINMKTKWNHENGTFSLNPLDL